MPTYGITKMIKQYQAGTLATVPMHALAHLPGASSELFISEVLRCQVNQPKKVSKCQHLWIHEQDQRMPLDDEDLPSSSSCSSWLMFISSIQSWATRLYRILLQSDGERKAL